MTDQELEQRLADAINRAAPNDIEAVLSRCAPRQDNVIPLQQDRPAGGRKKWKRWIPAAAAASMVPCPLVSIDGTAARGFSLSSA